MDISNSRRKRASRSLTIENASEEPSVVEKKDVPIIEVELEHVAPIGKKRHPDKKKH